MVETRKREGWAPGGSNKESQSHVVAMHVAIAMVVAAQSPQPAVKYGAGSPAGSTPRRQLRGS